MTKHICFYPVYNCDALHVNTIPSRKTLVFAVLLNSINLNYHPLSLNVCDFVKFIRGKCIGLPSFHAKLMQSNDLVLFVQEQCYQL